MVGVAGGWLWKTDLWLVLSWTGCGSVVVGFGDLHGSAAYVS